MSGVKRDSTMTDLSWPDVHQPSGTSSVASSLFPTLSTSLASTADPPLSDSMIPDGTYGAPATVTPPPFATENTDLAGISSDSSPDTGFVLLVNNQLTFILQRYGDDEDLQVQECNIVRGSMRESKIEYFFHRLVGSWSQAQILGNYWKRHYGL
eukprot:s894_g28.t1